MRRLAIIIGILAFFSVSVAAQHVTLDGKIVDREKKEPVEFASVLLEGHELWAITDKHGAFTIRRIPTGEVTLIVQCLGYVKRTVRLHLTKDTHNLRIELDEDNLKLEEVEVVAKRITADGTTSYLIDRNALDNQQVLSLGDVSSLLPGGKTVNSTLLNDDRIALRSGSTEKGNPSFGTAIEVDGVRLDNNAAMNETGAYSASTRNISASNIERVEIITGIPSVEYGDLSNGVVKVSTRKGKSPYMIEGKLNQHTRQVALSKGFDLGRQAGLLNVSLEHARSFSNAASPHTAYTRNGLSLNYMKQFLTETMPLTLNIGLSGNIGGYNSKQDPDNDLDNYDKMRDNYFRANVKLNWLLNKRWITNLSLSGNISYTDRTSTSYTSTSSASTQPYIHTREEGYFMSKDYDEDPHANIIVGPTGHWYLLAYNVSRPLTYSLKLKADWTHRIGRLTNKLLVGAEYAGSKNNGRGTYYDDMRYAPSWREYRYDKQSPVNNIGLYLENKLTIPTSERATLELTAGIRDDITVIGNSVYGNVSSFSPRFNSRYIFWRNRRDTWVRDFSIHAGWGKSVKLPSMQMLYPAPHYSDLLAFSSTSNAENKAYYAYYTYPIAPLYNTDLKWQYTNQTDIGVEMNVKGTRINISAFHHKTFNPYMMINNYTPITYKYTGPSSLNGVGVAIADRQFEIDRTTGIVTLYDLSGTKSPQQLGYKEHRIYSHANKYVNACPITRWGIEWIIDFAKIKSLRTSLRLDGKYYYYKGIDDVLYPGVATNHDIPIVGYYRGSNATSTGYSASASVTNGKLSKQINMNATLTTHIPEIRMIVALRLETSLYTYNRALCEFPGGKLRGFTVEEATDYFGEPYDGKARDKFVVVYPEYYSTWDEPATLIPFEEKFRWAYDNDRALYNKLALLVQRSNYAYVLNPDRLSRYYSANITITKEIGDHVTLSFYANNFFTNMKRVHSTQTDTYTSLFGSGYIPSFYYGLSLKLKI